MMKKLLMLLGYLCLHHQAYAELNLRSKSSVLKLADDARFVVDSNITGFSGTLVQDNQNSLSGKSISFNDGVLRNQGKNITLSGALDPSAATNIIRLTGGQTFRGAGVNIPYTILLSGQNNRIEGDFLLKSPIVLQDSNTSVTFAMVRRLNQDVVLNGGTFFLEDDLNFVDGRQLRGSGKVLANRRKIVLGAENVTWTATVYFDNGNDLSFNANVNLASTMTFSGGNNTVNGNGNILTLQPGAAIIVERGSSVRLQNLQIRGIIGSNIRCLDNAGQVICQDVNWAQDGDFTFTLGSLHVGGVIGLTGASVFAYQSVMTSTIDSFSSIYLDRGFTFSYDPLNSNPGLINFTDVTSLVYMDGANLHATKGGMLLRRGSVILSDVCSVFCEAGVDPLTNYLTGSGVIIGNNNSNDDFNVEILQGALLDVAGGVLIYRNANVASWRMSTVNSILRMNARTTLQIDQPMNFGRGRLFLNNNATLIRSDPSFLIGTVELFT